MIIAYPAPPVSAFSMQHHAHTGKVPPVAAHKVLPSITYIGGKHPHVTVSPSFGWDDAGFYRLHTPRGWVTVHWQRDSGTEGGGPVPLGPEPDISHPDTIFNIVVVSPPSLPVYFRGAGDAKWAHLNGHRIPSVETRKVTPLSSYYYTHPADPVRMKGGTNSIAIGYPDAE